MLKRWTASRRVMSEAGLPAVEKAKRQRPSTVADLVTLRAEATMHRVDAELTAGVPVGLVATDTDARWLVEVGSWTVPSGKTGPRAARAKAGEPTAVVTAPVGGLALWAWTRGGTVDISGQQAARDALVALITQGMP
jgi:hypothetical protein